MTSPRTEESLIARLLALPVTERTHALEQACRDDATLRDRLPAIRAALSAADSSAPTESHGSFAPGSMLEVLKSALDIAPTEVPGRRIGPYKLLQEIGQGGFGVVWMVEQEEPIRRRLALKIIKAGMDTMAVITRFEAERQALAMMDHANIARVFDAGATEAGRPYFVMELVRGVAITRYCDDNRLSTEARLQLFMTVCQAVQHAHQKGVIHRDLKPSNILVTLHDGVPVPKIIDFGIAKATSGVRLTDKTLFTQFHAFIGTPAYTSPEQMEMSGLDVDTRSDIYSLGVLLYELLAGRPPFDADALVKSGLEAMRRTIREIDPPRPSNRLTTLTDAERTFVAEQRRTEAAKLSVLLRGDLDWIVMRCLEKDRTRRYETANGLANDIQRHLASEPVAARPPSLADQAQKFSRRHRTVVIASGAVLAALIIGLGVALVGFRRAVTQQRAAQAARLQAETLVGFIMRDLQPSLLAHGRLPVVKKTIQAAIRYFEELPPELHNLATMRGHAQALEALVTFSGRSAINPLGEPDPKAAHEAAQRALRLRHAIIAADPTDADSAAAVLEDELHMVTNQDEDLAFDWDKPNQDFIRRYRELEARFPDNLRVKRGLAAILANRGMWLSDLNAANEALHRWEQLVAAHPDDNDLRSEYVVSLGSMADHYKHAGNAGKSLEAGEKAVAAAQALLKTDPTNLRLLSIATAMARQNIWWSEPASLPRAIEAARMARGHYRMLRLLDPTNPGWHEKEMEVASFEALLLRLDNQPEPARKLLDELLVPAGLVATAQGKLMLLNLLVMSGESAGAAGDLPVTRVRLQTIRDGLKGYPLEYPEHSIERPVARFTWLRAQAKLAVVLQDWPEVARLGQEMINETERALHALPGGESQLRPRRADAQAYLGKALLREGNPKEAVGWLQQAAVGLRDDSDWSFNAERWDDLRVLNHEDLPEALRLTGDVGQARSLLETALTETEAELAKRPGRWPGCRAVVQATVRLAEVLDPANSTEGAHRQAVLDRAADLFSTAGAEAQMNAGDRELKARIQSLR